MRMNAYMSPRVARPDQPGGAFALGRREPLGALPAPRGAGAARACSRSRRRRSSASASSPSSSARGSRTSRGTPSPLRDAGLLVGAQTRHVDAAPPRARRRRGSGRRRRGARRPAACEADGTLARIAEVLAARDAVTREFFARGGRPLRAGPPPRSARTSRRSRRSCPTARSRSTSGTGDGALLEVLAPRLRARHRVDRSDAQLARAAERVRRRELDNVKLVPRRARRPRGRAARSRRVRRRRRRLRLARPPSRAQARDGDGRAPRARSPGSTPTRRRRRRASSTTSRTTTRRCASRRPISGSASTRASSGASREDAGLDDVAIRRLPRRVAGRRPRSTPRLAGARRPGAARHGLGPNDTSKQEENA